MAKKQIVRKCVKCGKEVLSTSKEQEFVCKECSDWLAGKEVMQKSTERDNEMGKLQKAINEMDAVILDLNRDIVNTSINILDNLRDIKAYSEKVIGQLEKVSSGFNPDKITGLSEIYDSVNQLRQRHSIISGKWGKIEAYNNSRIFLNSLLSEQEFKSEEESPEKSTESAKKTVKKEKTTKLQVGTIAVEIPLKKTAVSKKETKSTKGQDFSYIVEYKQFGKAKSFTFTIPYDLSNLKEKQTVMDKAIQEMQYKRAGSKFEIRLDPTANPTVK